MFNNLYLASVVGVLGVIVVGAKACEWNTPVVHQQFRNILPPHAVPNQVLALDRDIHETRQDINVGKYYFAVQSVIGLGFFTYLVRSGNSSAMALATTTVGVAPGLLFAKIKIDSGFDRLSAIKAAQNSLLLRDVPQRLVK
mgnify:CR=1 FL=1